MDRTSASFTRRKLVQTIGVRLKAKTITPVRVRYTEQAENLGSIPGGGTKNFEDFSENEKFGTVFAEVSSYNH